MQSDTTAYLNTPTLIAPALASFTHRHLKLDADRQAHELHRLASLRSGGFLLEELAELSKLLVLASRAPHVAQLVPVLARVVRLCGSAQPRADRSSESSRQPEPITAILDALGALLASPHDAVFAAAGESLEAIARRLGEAPTQASPPQPPPLVGIRALEASTAPLAALDCLLGTCVEFRQRILCQLLSVISRRSAVVCTALVQERALQLLDAVAAPAATSATTITAAPPPAPAAAAADPDSDDEPLSTPPADGLPNEEEGLLLGKTKHGRGQSAPPQLVAARIERARTALHSAPPHRAAQSASPRPAAVEGGAARGSDEWQPSGTRARQLQLLLQMCTLAPPAAHAALATPHAAALLVAPLRELFGASTSESHRLVRNDAVALGALLSQADAGPAALLASGLYGLYISAAIAAEAPQLLRADEVAPLAPCASGRSVHDFEARQAVSALLLRCIQRDDACAAAAAASTLPHALIQQLDAPEVSPGSVTGGHSGLAGTGGNDEGSASWLASSSAPPRNWRAAWGADQRRLLQLHALELLAALAPMALDKCVSAGACAAAIQLLGRQRDAMRRKVEGTVDGAMATLALLTRLAPLCGERLRADGAVGALWPLCFPSPPPIDAPVKLAPPALPLTDALQQPRPPPLGLPASVTTVTPASSTQPSARRASIRAERALATPREMERTFWMLDTNRSGAIDRKELRKALAALGFDADLPATRAALAQYDKDLGRTIDLFEFTKLVRGLVYAIDAENAPPPPPPPLDEPPPQLQCEALECLARLATEDGAHAELCERDVIGVLVARLLTPSAVDERVAARELRLLAAVSSHPEGSAAATRAAHLLENHGAVDAMLARLPRMPMVLLPLAFSTLADWCATPALLVELLNWQTGTDAEDDARAAPPGGGGGGGHGDRHDGGGGAGHDEHRAGSGGHGGGLQRLLRVWEAWEEQMLALHKPDVYLIKPVPRSGLGLPPRPAPSEILAPPPPPPELPAWAEVSDGHDAALASAAERALLGAADLRGKLCAIVRAARRMSVSVPPLSPRYEALLVAVEAHKELQTCRAWHSVARDVHAERIRVVAADAARLETALAAGARRVEATWAAQEVLWAEREAGMLEAEAAKANGFAAREATRKSLVANKSVHGVPTLAMKRRGRAIKAEMLQRCSRTPQPHLLTADVVAAATATAAVLQDVA